MRKALWLPLFLKIMEVTKLNPVHKFSSNTFLLQSEGEYAVIDPSVPYDESLIDGKLKYILLTHVHFDHMLDIDSWVDNTGAEVIVSSEEKVALFDPDLNCYSLFFAVDRGYFGPATGLADGDVLCLGSENIRVMGCPGHTRMGLTYLIDDKAFVGDNVFSGGGFGRWDFPGGNLSQLKQTISKIIELPEETVLYCGHGDNTTVKEFRQDYKKQRLI